MMSKTAKDAQIQVRISSDEKEDARELFARYGLSLSAAFQLFIRRSLEENQLPFSFEDLSERAVSRGSRMRSTQ